MELRLIMDRLRCIIIGSRTPEQSANALVLGDLVSASVCVKRVCAIVCVCVRVKNGCGGGVGRN